MACYRPIPALQRGPGQKPTLWPLRGEHGEEANLSLPCGRCIGCRAARATQWAQRCHHEASQWAQNTFLTLTYADEHLPADGHLDAVALQRFFKRLRKRVTSGDRRIQSDPRGTVRYFACGEYGERNNRPHYHAFIFNCGFGSDSSRGVGKDLYEAEVLDELWKFGRHTFGPATAAAANYIAQYTLKKQGAGDHDADGVWRPAPFLRMSLKPAIGSEWLEKYKDDLQHGYLVANGHRHAIPRTYREKLKLRHPGLAEDIDIRTQKHRHSFSTGEHNNSDRRTAAELIHQARKRLSEKRLI